VSTPTAFLTYNTLKQPKQKLTMKIKFRLFNRKWKSISIYTKKREIIIRYWGGLKFDVIKIYAA